MGKTAGKTPEFSERAIIFANGPVPPESFVTHFIRQNDLIVCADGGANRIVNYNIRPDIIIGDFDSVTVKTLRVFEGVKLRRAPDQETNDLFKALEHAESRGAHEVIVFGATGDRHDHFLANLSLLRDFHDRLDIRFIDEVSAIILVTEKFTISGAKGQTVSLWPITEKAKGVTTTGLKYPLDNETLYQNSRGLSNEIIEDEAEVTIKSGQLIAIFNHSDKPV